MTTYHFGRNKNHPGLIELFKEDTPWKVGQKVVALNDAATFKPDGTIIEKIIEIDKVYQISSIESGCCINLLDIGKINNRKETVVIYKCKKCNKQFQFKENEPILLNEKWFRPFDENESMVSKAVRKLSNLFFKKKIEDGYFVEINIEAPSHKPKIQDVPVQKPKRVIRVKPEREEEFA